MTLILMGLNYQTASLEVREQVYLSESKTSEALTKLHETGLDEAVILSTCNRLEIFGVTGDAPTCFERLLAFMNTLPTTPLSGLEKQVYWLEGQDVVRHIMRVACGLESRILGETQILGQVVTALEQTQIAGTGGAILSRLLTAAVHTGKRARTETEISQHTLSVSHAAANHIKSTFKDKLAPRVLIVGAGEMAELAAEALLKHGIHSLEIINRTHSKAEVIARKFGVLALKWGDLLAALNCADVVIAATSASQPIIRFTDVVNLELQHSLILIDLGVPRNIDPQIDLLPTCKVTDIDRLNDIVETNLQQRYVEVKHVEEIVEEEADLYEKWFREREIVPLIVQLRGQAEAVAQSEFEQTLNRLPGLKPHEQAILNQMAHRIVNKMLHAPMMTLKTRIADGHDFEYTQAIRELFALDEITSA